MVITKKICPLCKREVELNGSGSTQGFFMSGVTWLINKLYPITEKLFRPASDWHDMAYHQGIKGKKHEADDTFHRKCLELVDNPDQANEYVCIELILGNSLPRLSKIEIWLVKSNRWWFRYQAGKFYEALKLGGDLAYPKCSCTECIND